ncbi:ABC transporter substrate-binding protein [Mangrovicella endophytica]|uniref:ABC transporter substrate-binding protein n=1 Tax=Mangrovicella endophytica TaxID=2066697 RepID=UPI000C9DFD09|nr:ABC transporter substrate-binding protein [Mangrovicella endophytica]
MPARKHLLAIAAVAGLALPSAAAHAQEAVTLVLNWTPTADHAAYYYALQQGWYEKAGLSLSIEVGRGSAVSAQQVGVGAAQFGVSDLATAMVARGKGAEVTAVMSVYANTPQGFYWLKSSGINGPKDFPEHRIGNPPGDASRVMWPAFAQAAGIEPDSVSFVNVAPPAKMPSLKSGAVEIISDFYNEHDLKLREFGDNLGYVGWAELGLNPYGNSIIVNSDFLQENEKAVAAFVQVSQRAFAACVEDVEPCLAALTAGASGLDLQTQRNQWERIKSLMTDDFTTKEALGWIDRQRLQDDYKLVSTYIGFDKPFEIDTMFTTRFLDKKVKMDASKVKK